MSAPDGPDVVGIGASAGGVEALSAFLSGLDPALPAAVAVVLHQSASAPSVLPAVLGRRCPLPVVHARDGAGIEAGTVYVAPPDRHLLVDDGRLAVTRGPKENGHRPGIDPLLRSLALDRGPAAVGVVLSGMLDDGASGLLALVRHGGAALVQDPDDALYPPMPEAALRQVPGAAVASAGDLGGLLGEVLARPRFGSPRPTRQLEYEVAVSRASALAAHVDPPGPAAGLTCPDCAGPLFDLSDDGFLRFRCRVGHAWSQDSLHHQQDERVEHALYSALQALEEKAAIQHRIAETAARRGATRVAGRASTTSRRSLASADIVRRLLTGDAAPDAPGGRAERDEETS